MPAHVPTPRTPRPPTEARPTGTPATKAPVAAGKPSAGNDFPAAGPHAKPHLTDPEKTPGAGALPDPGRPRDGDATG